MTSIEPKVSIISVPGWWPGTFLPTQFRYVHDLFKSLNSFLFLGRICLTLYFYIEKLLIAFSFGQRHFGDGGEGICPRVEGCFHRVLEVT